MPWACKEYVARREGIFTTVITGSGSYMVCDHANQQMWQYIATHIFQPAVNLAERRKEATDFHHMLLVVLAGRAAHISLEYIARAGGRTAGCFG